MQAGPRLPTPSARHCAVALLDDEDRVVLYGGVREFQRRSGDRKFNLHLAVSDLFGLSHIYSFANESWQMASFGMVLNSHTLLRGLAKFN